MIVLFLRNTVVERALCSWGGQRNDTIIKTAVRHVLLYQKLLIVGFVYFGTLCTSNVTLVTLIRLFYVVFGLIITLHSHGEKIWFVKRRYSIDEGSAG